MACPYEKPCYEVWPGSPADWCPDCQDAYYAWPEEDPVPPLVAASLELEALWRAWLACADRPAWSLEQVTRPSPN